MITRCIIPGEVACASVGDGTVLLHMGTKRYFSLNDTGAEIWRMLEQGVPVSEIPARLTATYDVPLADVRNAFRGEVLVADLEGDDLYSAAWAGTATLWIFGSEGQGLSAETRALSARRLRIPIAPGVESLNVAAAAAVCLFEQRRRRISAA